MGPIHKIGVGLMDKTGKLLAHALDYRAKRHGVIAGNLANIDTPGYKPKDVEFDDALKQAMREPKLKLTITQPEHMPARSSIPPISKGQFPLHEIDSGVQSDSQVDLDREMTKMAKNNLLYEATVRMLSKKFDELKAVIEEGGK